MDRFGQCREINLMLNGFTVEEHNIIQAYGKADFIDQESIKRTLKVKSSERHL